MKTNQINSDKTYELSLFFASSKLSNHSLNFMPALEV